MLDELLVLATYDWLVPGFFVQAADLAVIDAAPEVRTAIGMGLAAEWVARGWFRIGDVDHDGFRAWSGTTEKTIGRLIADWLREARPDRPTEFAWFELTDPGRAVAMERRQARAVPPDPITGLDPERQARYESLAVRFADAGLPDAEGLAMAEATSLVPSVAPAMAADVLWREAVEPWLAGAPHRDWGRPPVDGMHPARLDVAAIEARDRMTAAGASEADLSRFGARVAADALGVTLYRMTSEYPRRPGLPGVMLVETDADGRSTGRPVVALEVELGRFFDDPDPS